MLLFKYLFRLSEWSNEGKKEGAHIESEINQMADLISAVLLYSVSKTYQSISRGSIMKTSAKHDEQLEDDVISSCINLLAQNDILLKQLLKKWINILGGRNIAIYYIYIYIYIYLMLFLTVDATEKVNSEVLGFLHFCE